MNGLAAGVLGQLHGSSIKTRESVEATIRHVKEESAASCIDVEGTIWTSADAAVSWVEAGSADGQAQAIALTSSGEIAVADDSGLRLLGGDQ